jgi:hypothetical protein
MGKVLPRLRLARGARRPVSELPRVRDDHRVSPSREADGLDSPRFVTLSIFGNLFRD